MRGPAERRTMRKIFCDACGKEVKENKLYVVKVMPYGMYVGGIGDKSDILVKEVCPSCADLIVQEKETKVCERAGQDFWDTHDPSGGDLPAEDQARQQEENDKEKKKGTPRRTVDYGKLLALRNAGWSLKKIAEEVHMTELGVSLAIRKAKEEKSKNEGGNL